MASQGKVFVLTGASRGIGLAIAHYLLKHSSRLVVVARSEGPLKQLQTEYPDQVQTLAGDLSNFDLGRKAVDIATREWGILDGVIVNHGVLEPVKKFEDIQVDEWKDAFDINFFSIVALIQAALPALRKSKGNIILTSSGAATAGYTAWGPYGATKAAMNHLAMTLAEEEKDVTTLAIRPGVVDTEMQRRIRETHTGTMDPKHVEKFTTLHSTGQILRPEQPGHVIARLALDAPSSLSGRFTSWNDDILKAYQE